MSGNSAVIVGEDGEENDLGTIGALLPEDTSQAPANTVGDELLSRASLQFEHAVGFVLDALRSDPRDEVQAKGLRAISQIAERKDGRETLIKHGAVETVIEAMLSAVEEEVELQASGCSGLANLAISEGEAVVHKHGGLKAVIAAGQAHPADLAVQTKVCAAIGNLAYSSDGEKATLEGGGVEAVCAAMRAHPADAALQEEGVDALVNVCDSEAGKRRLLEMGGLAVVAAAKKHEKCAEAAGAFAASLVALAKASA